MKKIITNNLLLAALLISFGLIACSLLKERSVQAQTFQDAYVTSYTQNESYSYQVPVYSSCSWVPYSLAYQCNINPGGQWCVPGGYWGYRDCSDNATCEGNSGVWDAMIYYSSCNFNQAWCGNEPPSQLGTYVSGYETETGTEAVTAYTCNYISAVTGWSSCSDGAQVATGVTWSSTSGSSCSNVALTQACIASASLSASSNTIDNGRSVTISWNSTNAASCTAAGGFSTGGATSGSVSVSPSASSNSYQISCAGVSGYNSGSSNVVTVTVIPSSVTISANPERVNTGESSTITWNASQTGDCTVSGPGLSSASKTGSQVANDITSQSVYTISCRSLADGSSLSQSAIVNVVPDFEEF